MSFNVRYGTAEDGPYSWQFRRDACVEAMRAFSPDVIGVQEALDFQVDEIKAALQMDYVGVGRDKWGTRG